MISRKFFHTLKLLISVFIVAGPTLHALDKQLAQLNIDPLYNIELTFNPELSQLSTAQSLSHYSHPHLQHSFMSRDAIKSKIVSIGKSAFEKIINDALTREIELASSHYVFYHGCKIEFLLYQDLLKILTEIKLKKTLKDFFLLRIPSKKFNAYQSTAHFLEKNKFSIDDSISPQRDYLLSVTPALFGNALHRPSSSAFCYFLESRSAFSINSLQMISAIFEHYQLKAFYKKYEQTIKNLSKLLTHDEDDKTGILLQIFIPKEYTNKLTYLSEIRGIPLSSKTSFQNIPTTRLMDYQSNSTIFKSWKGPEVDNMQYRILFNHEHMLNVNNTISRNPIKMFRYFNQTATIKRYQKELAEFKKIMERIIK